MRAIRISVGFVVVLGVIVAGLPTSIAGAHSAYGGREFYVALGDSLAAGFQPGRGATEKGYVDRLWKAYAERIDGLALRNFRCSGETSASMITGEASPCSSGGDSQLDAAVAFIENHPGTIAFITVNIGMNDLFERCLGETGQFPRSCVRRALPEVQGRLSDIFDALASAAGSDVPILSMTNYDPLLGLWGVVPGGRVLARVSLRSIVAANEAFATTYEEAGVAVADVGGIFEIEHWSTVVVSGRGRVPLNVALTCRWTWFCSRRFFGDPHPDRTGYRRIAHAFSRELEDLVPA
jgi:lysophospholipase L1-like esterase